MRKNEILTINAARRDLLPQPEFWAEAKYEEKFDKLLEIIKEKTSFLPPSNTKVIREISFHILPTTTLGDLKEVCHALEESYKISCFQISIDRKAQEAHLLAAWVNQQTGKAIQLSDNTLKRFTGTLMRRLPLPRPKNYEDWVRYILLDAYEESPDVFKQQLDKLPLLIKGQSNYSIIRDALIYAELMSKGKVK